MVGICSLEELVAGAWQVQERLEGLADGADNPRGLLRGLATMSAVAQQRSKLQVYIHIHCFWFRSAQVNCTPVASMQGSSISYMSMLNSDLMLL